MRRVFIKTNPGPLKQCECFPNQIVRNEYSLTEAARGFIANTRKYISAPINHLPSFLLAVEVSSAGCEREVDSATQQCQSQCC